MRKKQLIAEGKLDKHGKPNDNTPAEYLRALAADGTTTKVTAVATKDGETGTTAVAVVRPTCAHFWPCSPHPLDRDLMHSTIHLGDPFPPACALVLQAVSSTAAHCEHRSRSCLAES